MNAIPSNVLWDEHSWHAINVRQVRQARDAGALARLPIDLDAWAILVVWRATLQRLRPGLPRPKRSLKRPDPLCWPTPARCSQHSADAKPTPRR